ncbi:MAG: S41 family peptidase [Woeseiaceae bacterium]|nr:S41 family peptidase [Woeseiaceae bacterium]
MTRIATILALATVAQADEYPQPLPLTEEAVREDIALARDALETIHPVYGRRDLYNLDAAWEKLEARAGGMDDVELYVRLSSLTEQLRCDHTKLELPERLQSARRVTASFFPFRADVFGDSDIVLSATAGSGFRAGDRIISIDGRSMTEIAEEIYALLPVDGGTDYVKPGEFVEIGDFGVSGFEHFYPLLYGNWSLAEVVIERDGERMSVAATPITMDEWLTIPWDGPVSGADFTDSVSFEVLEDGIGYLRVDTFVNYRRPVDPRDIYAPIFERIQEEGIESLIIDTRRNGGGSDDAMIALMAYLLSDPFTLMRGKHVRTIDLSRFGEHIDTWDPAALTPDPANFVQGDNGWYRLREELDPLTLQPAGPLEPNFDGPVYALTSRSNASAVTMMLAVLRERGNDVTLVGERTGGSSTGPNAGMIFFLELPNSGITLRIPWQRQWLNVEHPEIGFGVTPAVEVVRTAEDALAGRDVALETALDLARGNQINDSSK